MPKILRVDRRRAATAAALVLLGGSISGCAGLASARADTADSRPASATAPDCLQAKCVALTFDDGPGAQTARLLDLLAENGARATFFMPGRQAQAHPDLVKRAAADGHEIGAQPWNQARLTSLPAAGAVRQVNRTADEVETLAGVRPDALRPPVGAITDGLAQTIGLPVVLWSVDSRDWESRDVDRIVDTVRSDVRPGSVVIMHDTYAASVDAVERLLDDLREDGYSFVTVRDLFGSDLLPGKIVRGNEDAYAKAQATEQRAHDKQAQAREYEEYLEHSGQPRTGAAPGPLTP